MNYDPTKVIEELAKWREKEYPQLKIFHVEKDCLPRFKGLHPVDTYNTTPEVTLVLKTDNGYPWGTDSLIESLRQMETDFYDTLAIDGQVPEGQVSYRGTFWSHHAGPGGLCFHATLSYATKQGFITSPCTFETY